MAAGVAILDDVIVNLDGFGLGLGGDVLVEVAGRRRVSQNNELAGAVVDSVKAIGRGSFDVSGSVFQLGVLAEVFRFAGEKADHSLVGNEDGLLGFDDDFSHVGWVGIKELLFSIFCVNIQSAVYGFNLGDNLLHAGQPATRAFDRGF